VKLSYVGFSEDLRKAYLYLMNEGCYTAHIKSVSLNGEDATATSEIKQKDLPPKDKTLIVLRSEKPFEVG